MLIIKNKVVDLKRWSGVGVVDISTYRVTKVVLDQLRSYYFNYGVIQYTI